MRSPLFNLGVSFMAYSHCPDEKCNPGLFVLNGELSGVSVPLTDKPVRVGEGQDCDIVFLDNECNGAEVTLAQNADGCYILSDPEGKVHVGHKTLKSAGNLTVRPGTVVTLGSVEFMLSGSMTDTDHVVKMPFGKQMPFGYSTGIIWAASLAAAVCFIGGLSLLAGRGNVQAGPASAYIQQTQPQTHSVGVAAASLRSQLDAAGLKRLEVSTDSVNGTVVVRGGMRVAEEDKLSAVSRQFDAVYGGIIMLDVQTHRSNDTVTLPFLINAIWMDNNPRLTLHNGSKRYEGDTLPGGWRLEKINPDRVTISRGDETLMIPL